MQRKLNNFFHIHKNEYQIIHYHAISIWHFSLLVAKKAGVKHRISHSHATMYSDKKLNAIRNKLLINQMKRNANYYFACSEAAGRFLYGESSVNCNKVKVVNNAVDCEKFRYDQNERVKIRKELDINDDFVISHVGRFNEQKNHLFLIDIFKSILKKRPNTMLILVGEGPLMSTVREKVEKYKIEDKVIILGKRNDVSSILSGADVFLLPSLFEGLPFVGVEAQASGVPIVMSDTITKEIGLKKYLYISLEESVEIWADKILSLDYKIDRTNSYKDVMNSGFDIYKETLRLEKMYAKME